MNAIEAFRNLLLSRSAITALVGQRIYGGNTPEPVAGAGIGESESIAEIAPMILLNRVGSSTHDRLPITHARIDVRCTAETLVAAQAIFDAINTVNNTNNYRLGAFHFFSIRGDLSETDNREQITDSLFFPTVYSTWDVQVGAAT